MLEKSLTDIDKYKLRYYEVLVYVNSYRTVEPRNSALLGNPEMVLFTVIDMCGLVWSCMASLWPWPFMAEYCLFSRSCYKIKIFLLKLWANLSFSAILTYTIPRFHCVCNDRKFT